MKEKFYSQKEALKIIVETAKSYDKLLKNKDFLIIFDNGKKLDYILVGFTANNYHHLTGASKSISPKDFYRKCISGKLTVDELPKITYTINKKLLALPYLPKMMFNACSVGNYLSTNMYLNPDYVVGNVPHYTCLALVDYGNDYLAPMSLLYDDIRQKTNPTQKAEIIFQKSRQETYFSDYTYCHKNFDISLLSKCEFASIIQNPHYYKNEFEPIQENSSNVITDVADKN